MWLVWAIRYVCLIIPKRCMPVHVYYLLLLGCSDRCIAASAAAAVVAVPTCQPIRLTSLAAVAAALSPC
jgi:hypothetical protein